MKSTILEGIHYWSSFQSDRGIDFNGFFWERPGGNVLIDPMPLDAGQLKAVQEAGGARWILITNFDHLRAGPELKEALGAEILAPAAERDAFTKHGELVDHWFEGADDLPGELGREISVHSLPGGKSPGEVALYLEGPRALLFGDVVRSHVSGALRLLPDPKISDRAALVEALQPLRKHAAQSILLGDGDSFWRDGAACFAALLDELG